MNKHKILLEDRDLFKVDKILLARDLLALRALASSLDNSKGGEVLVIFSKNSRRCLEAMANNKGVNRFRQKDRMLF